MDDSTVSENDPMDYNYESNDSNSGLNSLKVSSCIFPNYENTENQENSSGKFFNQATEGLPYPMELQADSHSGQGIFYAPYPLARSDSFRDDMDPSFNMSGQKHRQDDASKLTNAFSPSSSSSLFDPLGPTSPAIDTNSGPETPAKKRRESSEFKASNLMKLSGNETKTSLNGEGKEVPSRFLMDFELQSFMGTGTFGTVMRVRNKMSNVYYAVKKSRRPFISKSDRQLMLQEVGTMAELSAASDDDDMSHLVRYYAGWIEDDHVYLQMELCEISVEAMLSNYTNKLEIKEIYRILRHVFLGLKFMHESGLVHLDIKPGNILKKKNMYKISDFGLSVHTNKGKASGNVEEGDSRYLAKEMLDWDPVEDLTKCDIFSVGVSAYELVSNSPVPTHGDDWQKLRGNHWVAPQGSSNELTDILSVTMNSNPKMRPTAANALSQHVCLMSDIERELHYQKLRVAVLNEQLDAATHAPKTRLRRHHSAV